jgi:hypothetical protein
VSALHEWTFSSTAEYVVGILLAVLIIAALFV